MQTQLDGFDAPEILTYSLESTVAEKLDAILQRFELTSRMKDFYDIYYLSRTFDFEGEKLKTALQKTLQNRGTHYGEDTFARVLALAEDEDMNVKWRHFLRTLGSPELSFQSVTNAIGTFLQHVWGAMTLGDTMSQNWSATAAKWS
jgi:predicted nucleotidyltransferase component of viral defense system